MRRLAHRRAVAEANKADICTLQVTLLSGSIVRVWAVLEAVLKRHEHELSKADRAMRITRVDMATSGVLVGVRYKDALLGEVRGGNGPEILGWCLTRFLC